MLVPMTLAALVRVCAPAVAARTELAVIQVESGGKPWAIGDNTARRSYVFASRDEAVEKARFLVLHGHNLDLGLAQLNTIHLHAFRLTVASALDPCLNVWAGSTVLKRAYATARARYGPGQLALFHAFEAYNSGNLNGAARYASAVWSAGAMQ
jgi:type IV secretion system protein VirB1